MMNLLLQLLHDYRCLQNQFDSAHDRTPMFSRRLNVGTPIAHCEGCTRTSGQAGRSANHLCLDRTEVVNQD